MNLGTGAWGWLLLTLVILPGCRQEPPLEWPARAPGSSRGGVLRLTAADDVPTLDPALGYDSRSWTFEQQLFETLVTYDEASTLVPMLAERWEISDDHTRYRFELAPNVTFSDGTPLTAADAVGSLERILDPRTRSQGAEYYRDIRGARDFIAGSAPHVVGLQAIDSTTIAIELNQPDRLFLDKLALLFAAVVPAERARQLGDDFSDHPLGSGPFTLREWRRGERIVLTRNLRYRRADRPLLDGIVEYTGVNGELAWLKFLSGEIDVAGIPSADFPSVRRNPADFGTLVHGQTLWTNYIGLNCQMPPLDDRRVRQALNYAVNKDDVIALLSGRGIVAQGVVPPGMPGYVSDVRGYPYDPERARALLSAAGHAGGFTTELWTQGNDLDLKIGQKVQRDLSQVGVTMEIKQVSWTSFLEAIRQPGTVPLFDLGWSADFPDPSNFLEVLFHSGRWDANNHTFYANPEFDRRLEHARFLRDPTARNREYAAAERLLIDDAPVLLLYHPTAYVMLNPRVHGYTVHPLLPARFAEVSLDPEPNVQSYGTNTGS